MATFDLGRVTPLYKGDYNASTSYELNDVVLYNGNLYWHVQATATVGIPPTDTTVWKLAFADEGVRAEIRGYADDAQVSKTAAAQSASQASASASNASASASQAASSAQTAGTKASEASTSAQTASTKASEATVSAQSAASEAQTATDKATLASQKAAAASASASIADEAKTVAINNAHLSVTKADEARSSATQAANSATSAQEYDESAQQSAVNAQTAQGLAETAQTAAETAQGLAEDARDLAQQYAESIDHEHIYSAYPTDTAEGSIASFSDGADDIPLKSLVVDINPVQSGSGDPSPDNVRPISGWTQVNVNHSDADTTNPTTLTIPLGQTVYGGKLDVLSGKLTVDMAMVDLGDLSWSYVASTACNFRASELIGAKAPATGTVTPNAICSILPVLDYATISTPVDGITIIFATSVQAGKVWAYSGTYTDATAFKAAMNGVMLCYELAEPIEIQLTPNQINSLLGVNNIWADSGDTEVEYRADTKLYIERLTEPDADMIADANVVSGQYFMVGNSLYLATSNIASGGQVIVGTNCIRKSLSEALNEINQ